ncbi:hypothetical protein FJ976_24010 [Mesorhizobium sp. B1-1-9]|uniref:hypothetical protein n=1 Tax=Mesorhizobium sp. B1-1-9 TaxID=2589975 RepID=UPI00112A043A|nr:hypothetical protein [Mesorhizobium sp. B1-1-9]TPN45302.1 hypothetical protein FJ976_24010 [Mesorhizobium sp. B1-1-9]
MIPIKLEWKRCQDGVDIFDTSKHGNPYEGPFARPRSKRFEPVTYDIPNLENPIAVSFANIRNETDALAFINRYGMPADVPEVSLEATAFAARQIRKLLVAANETDKVRRANRALEDVRLTPAFDQDGPGGTARLVLYPASLSELVQMEIAFAHEVGAQLGTCQHCRKHFLTGPLTGRRSSAVYCSDRCRVAAARKRNAQTGVR